MSSTQSGRAVVVGGSIAGLLTARVLSDVAGEVILIEREHFDDSDDARGHVPQGRHLHSLLAAGLHRLKEWFPGIAVELEGVGAVTVDGRTGWIFQTGGYRAQGDWGGTTLSLTRPLLEKVVRARVAALPNVTIVDGIRVDGVVVESGRVVGVLGGDRRWDADLVADCSGRSSRIAHHLETTGALVPPVTRVGIDVGYASRFLHRSPDDLDGDFIVIASTPEQGLRVGAAMPVEGDRWQVTLAGMHGDAPPTDDEGFAAFAESLPSPLVGSLARRCEPASEVLSFRFPSSQRRHFEKVPKLLPGLVVVGDAACSFDPIYGQGMSAAALQAEALGQVIAKAGAGRDALRSSSTPKSFHRRAARILDVPWTIAVGGDFAHPKTEGKRPRGSTAVNFYVDRVMRATHSSVPVARQLNQVFNLVAPAASLAEPRTLVRVLLAARRSPSVTGLPVTHPRVGPAPVLPTP